MTGATGHIATIPSKSNISRRAALGGLAVLTLPASAGAVCVLPEIDGADAAIFAAIRRYEAATDAIAKFDIDRDREEFECACGEHTAAVAALVAMTPQTLPGLAAQLRCIQAFSDYSDAHLFDEWFPPLSGPSKTFLGRVAAVLSGVRS